ncbi:MAG: MarR family transcriptional regulator [Hyphomicrobiaceae bacterium]
MQDRLRKSPVDLEIVIDEGAADGKLELRLWLRLLSTVTLISQEVRRRLRDEFATTLPQFDLLAQLDREPKGLRLGELSRRMMVTNGNITGVLDRLQAEGLVVREVSAEDRRVAYARLTPSGRARFRRYARAHEGWIRELVGDVDPAMKSALLAELARVKASVRRHAASEDAS